MSWLAVVSLVTVKVIAAADSDALTSAIDSVALSSLLIVPVAVLLVPDRTTRLAWVAPVSLGQPWLAVIVSLSSTMPSLLTVTVAVPVVLPARIVTRKLLRAV